MSSDSPSTETGATPAEVRKFLTAARYYAEAAELTERGPESAESVRRYFERNGITPDQDFERMVENPARHFYGWDSTPKEWPLAPEEWEPSPDVAGNLAKSRYYMNLVSAPATAPEVEVREQIGRVLNELLASEGAHITAFEEAVNALTRLIDDRVRDAQRQIDRHHNVGIVHRDCGTEAEARAWGRKCPVCESRS